MFSRMKQNLREKTGRAVATKLPQKLEADMPYYYEWEKRNTKLVKSIDELVESFKGCDKRSEIMSSLDALGSTLVGPTADGATALNSFLGERVKVEKATYKQVTALLKARCDTFAATDLKAIIDASNLLKKKRLARDGAESDYRSKPTDDRKAKFDCAESEFQKSLKQVEEYSCKIAEWDCSIKNIYVQTVTALGSAYELK